MTFHASYFIAVYLSIVVKEEREEKAGEERILRKNISATVPCAVYDFLQRFLSRIIKLHFYGWKSIGKISFSATSMAVELFLCIENYGK